MSEHEQPMVYQPRNDSSASKGCAIGCLILVLFLALIVAGIGGIFGFVVVPGMREMTQETPVEIPEVTLTPQERDDVLARFESFLAGMDGRGEPVPMELSGQELNALLRHFGPELDLPAEHVVLSIQEDVLKADVSIPTDDVPFLGYFAPGRYLNGAGVVSVSLTDGELEIYLEDIQFGQAPIPAEALQQLQQENLGRDLMRNPETRPYVEKLESIEVTGGKLIVTPKPQSGN